MKMNTSEWKQPAPTKAYAVWYDGAWYGQGDTVAAAWADVRRQCNADHDRFGARLYRDIRHGGQAKATDDMTS